MVIYFGDYKEYTDSAICPEPPLINIDWVSPIPQRDRKEKLGVKIANLWIYDFIGPKLTKSVKEIG